MLEEAGVWSGDHRQTCQVIDRYRFMNLLPLTATELKSIGYQVRLLFPVFNYLNKLPCRIHIMSVPMQSRNIAGLDPSILRHSGIWGAAHEAVLNNVQKKKIQNTIFPKFRFVLLFLSFPPFFNMCIQLWQFHQKIEILFRLCYSNRYR